MDRRIETVPLEKVVFREQGRRGGTRQALEELAASIKAHGMIHRPLYGVNSNGYDCIAGSRRTRAAMLLGWKEIEADVIRGELDPGERVALRAIENLQREDLNPMEVAAELQELAVTKSLNGKQIAQELGKTEAFVSRHLPLLKLPEPLQEQVRLGAISADVGYHLSRVESVDKQLALAAEVTGGKLTRDALVRKLRRTANAESSQTTKASRVTAKLPEGNVTVSAEDLSLDKLIAVLEATITRAKKARSQKLTLSTFVKALKDQAAA